MSTNAASSDAQDITRLDAQIKRFPWDRWTGRLYGPCAPNKSMYWTLVAAASSGMKGVLS
jgi:hypothetical protein